MPMRSISFSSSLSHFLALHEYQIIYDLYKQQSKSREPNFVVATATRAGACLHIFNGPEVQINLLPVSGYERTGADLPTLLNQRATGHRTIQIHGEGIRDYKSTRFTNASAEKPQQDSSCTFSTSVGSAHLGLVSLVMVQRV